jgi:hypothetical protein
VAGTLIAAVAAVGMHIVAAVAAAGMPMAEKAESVTIAAAASITPTRATITNAISMTVGFAVTIAHAQPRIAHL